LASELADILVGALGVRVQGMRVQIVARCNFHDLAKVHHRYPVTDMAHHSRIMGDKKEIHLVFAGKMR
jgi:hypothetical protein